MIIHWIPCYDHRLATWEQPAKDKIIVSWNGRKVAVDFSDTSIVEFDLDDKVKELIHKAWREGGILHLELPCFGKMKEETVVDYGEEERIKWIK